MLEKIEQRFLLKKKYVRGEKNNNFIHLVNKEGMWVTKKREDFFKYLNC